ncbi:MAG: serine protein kinase RIO [Candidatus Hadarchaeum sp.]|uniref:serine protein kinase RIO n=1 Tax=Candidatus Hadarchaeum sp. TaxID=2883567 RepID=UPI00317BF7F5
MEEDFESILSKLDRKKIERLEKDSEIYKIMARVFDTSTLLTLYRLINRGVFDVFYGNISAGKEANIYCALDKNGNYVAAKIYRIATSDFKNMHRYLVGDTRFKRVPEDRRGIIYTWTSREFKNLQQAYAAGVPVPRPIDHEKNVLAMEFIGEDGVPYPLLKDVKPKNPKKTFEILVDSVKKLYQEAEIVHSDLSEYNVMLTPDPVLIDFSMGTDIKNPMAEQLLMRDIQNLVRYFRKLGMKTPEPSGIFAEIVK